jgi:hypothetical protein
MTKQVQRRRGTAAQHTSFTGAEGEISVNTTNKSVHVHDGTTAGGVEAARADLGNVSDANLNAALSGNTLASLTITSADINGGTIDGTVIGGTTPAAISGTTGSFSGNLTVDTNTLFVDAANNRVGVGTSSPATLLHLDGGASAPEITLQASSLTSNLAQFKLDTAAPRVVIASSLSFPLAFDVNGTERLRITSTGSVGIGTSSPLEFNTTGSSSAKILTVYNTGVNSSSRGEIQIGNAATATGTFTGGIVFGSGASTTTSNQIASIYGVTNGDNTTLGQGELHFYTASAGSNSERMRIDSSGNVGIGTNSIASGGAGTTNFNVHTPNADTAYFKLSNTGTGNTTSDGFDLMVDGAGGSYVWNRENANMLFATNNTERMRITSAGLVGIGTSLPGNPLTLVYGGGAVGAQIIGNASYAQMQVTAAGADTNSYFTFGANGTGKGIIQRNSTDVIIIDASNNVGIGVSSPAYKLDVAGVIRSNTGIKSITASGGQPEFVLDQSGVASWTIYNPPSNTALRFYNGVDRMTITSTGSVGIGTSSPAAKLDVLVGGDERLLFGTLGVGNAIYSVDGPNAAYKVLHLVASDIVFRPNGTEHMRITSTGSVGIGTSSPVYKLVVSAAGASGIEFGPAYSGTANIVQHYSRSGGVYVDAVNVAAQHRFDISGAERARIDASGNLLVGTTSSSAARMDIVSGVNQNTVAMVCPSFNYNVGVFHNQGTSGDNAFVAFGTEASFTFRGSISYNRAGGLTAYNTTSDYRAKDIAGPISDASDAVLSLKPYMGTMKGATVERPMFVAHETQEIAPYAVTGEKDAVDGDGNPKYQQMDHSALVPCSPLPARGTAKDRSP